MKPQSLLLALAALAASGSDGIPAKQCDRVTHRRKHQRGKRGGGKGGAGVLLKPFWNPTGKPNYGQAVMANHIHPRSKRAA